MRLVAVSWQVYELTGSALDLGWVGLSQFLPAMLCSLPAGQAADRYDRKYLLVIAYGIDTICTVGLFTATLVGAPQTMTIYFWLCGVGAARALGGAANQAFLTNLVSADIFPRAVALNSSAFQLATIAGPALGGGLYSVVNHPTLVYGSCLILHGVAIVLLIQIPRSRSFRPPEPMGWKTLLAGLLYVWKKPIILGAISLDLFAVLLGGATALLPIYARDILLVGPLGLGFLRSGPGIGAAMTALWLSTHPLKGRTGHVLFLCVTLFGIFTILFGLSKNVYFSMIWLVLMGAADLVSVVIRMTLVQLQTPDAMRGRVSAVNLVFIGASNELGEFESGLTAHWWGPTTAVVVGGIGTCLVVVAWCYLFPQLRKLGELKTKTAME